MPGWLIPAGAILALESVYIAGFHQRLRTPVSLRVMEFGLMLLPVYAGLWLGRKPAQPPLSFFGQLPGSPSGAAFEFSRLCLGICPGDTAASSPDLEISPGMWVTRGSYLCMGDRSIYFRLRR